MKHNKKLEYLFRNTRKPGYTARQNTYDAKQRTQQIYLGYIGILMIKMIKK